MHPFRLLSVVVSLAAIAGPGRAETHLVPQMHATIQEAVNAADDGDTILIKSGTYEEAVLVDGLSSVDIRAKGKVILDPPDGGTALTLLNCTSVRVHGLRAQHGSIGFQVTGGSSCVLFKCRVEHMEAPIRVDGGTSTLVEKCIVTGSDNNGIDVGLTTPAQGATLSGNKILGVPGRGIRVNGTTCTLQFNKIVESGASGILVLGSGCTLHENTVIRSGAEGVQLEEGTGHLVEDCKVVKCSFDAIVCLDEATDVTVRGSKIVRPGGNGMDFSGDGSTVVGNKVSSPGSNGFFIAADDGTWTGNSCKGASSDGFHILGSGNIFTFNKAKGSGSFDLEDEGKNEIDETNSFKSQAE